MTPRLLSSIVSVSFLSLGIACAPGETTPDAGAPGDDESGPVCTELSDVPCEDAQFLEMALHDVASTRGIVSNTPLVKGGFETHVDATAGGFFAPPESFVYARFTDEGLEKVELSDDDAFASMDWDIAFRRYVFRLNSGVSGGSCVTGGRIGGVTFAELDEVPDNVILHEEQYFEAETCEFIADGSGLPSSPGAVLASYYSYTGCLQMNGNVYVIRLADGRHVKLEVVSYYDRSVQEHCDEFGTLPDVSDSGAGNVRVRWAFLD